MFNNTVLVYTYLGIHICSIQVYLSSIFVNKVTNISYCWLKDTIGWWICDHQTSQIFCVGVHLLWNNKNMKKIMMPKEHLYYFINENCLKRKCTFLCKSLMLTLPSASHSIGTTVIPAIWAEAGLVPWADTGIKQTFLPTSPLCSK